jgi:FixJ family two-component response regulator
MAAMGQVQHLQLSESAFPGSDSFADAPLVLIVDDDSDLREALQELMLSVGLASTCFSSATELLAGELEDRPGCLILDVRLPGLSGLDFQHQFRARGCSKPIIFLTAHGDIPMTVQAMKAGAVDFLTKPFRDQTLIDAVMAAIQIDISQRVVARRTGQIIERFSTLTPRERQVLREVVRGQLNKQIAFDLGISEVTVKLHRGNAMRKMQVVSVGNLVRAWEALPEALKENLEPRSVQRAGQIA